MLEEPRPDEVAFLQKLIRVMISFGKVGKFLGWVGGAALGLVLVCCCGSTPCCGSGTRFRIGGVR